MAALLVFIVFLVAIALSIPIGVSMILGSAAPIFLLEKGGSIVQVLHNTFSGANSTPILAVPLLILGGVIMAEGGISKRLFNFFAYFVGRFAGGIPCAVILTCLFYGAISGSGPATTAAVGAMCVPFMISLGYDRKWSAGLVAVAGGLGVIIPPSIPFVLYSLATGVSTGDLFIGGVLPGILIGLCLMAYAVFYCKRKGEDRELISAKMAELRSRGFLKLFIESLPALLCPIIVLGGIYAGFVSPTEAACISVFYALIVSLFVYKSIKFKDLIPMLRSAVKTYGGLAFVLAFATAFGRVLSLTKATATVTEFITALSAAYENAGLHLLGFLQNATYRLTTANTDLSTLDSFKGLQIRTMENSNHMAFWSAIGAEPTPLPWAEVYISLQNHVIAAQENAADTCVGASLQEVQDYLACTNHILYCNQICINAEAFASLDPAYQAALEQAVAEATAYMRPMLEQIDQDNKKTLTDGGMTLI